MLSRRLLAHHAHFRRVRRVFTLGILQETYNLWERRAPLTPSHVQELLSRHKDLNVLVQPSGVRIFRDEEYASAGAGITSDLSSADLILGVKRPVKLGYYETPQAFFSHTIKGQSENMGLLRDCLNHKVQLIDYERILHPETGKRLVAFGRYAGLAGAIDGLHALGRCFLYRHRENNPFLAVPTCVNNDSLDQAKDRILRAGERLEWEGVRSEPIAIAITGKDGAVGSGVMEILQMLPHDVISVEDLPRLESSSKSLQHKIYLLPLGTADTFQRKDGGDFNRQDFSNHPDQYRSVFSEIVPHAQAVFNSVYWDPRFPRLLTKQKMETLVKEGKNRLMFVADLSCDVHGSIEFLERTTTIEKPYFQYDPLHKREINDEISEHGITVMGVDILPTELPRESSEHFGDMLAPIVDDILAAKDETNALDARKLSPGVFSAFITTSDGQLEDNYRYLESMLKAAPSVEEDLASFTNTYSVEGHLFDSGLINQILDVIEQCECGVQFRDCIFPSHSAQARIKSSLVLDVKAKDEESLEKIHSKISLLVDVIEKADASFFRVDEPKRHHGTAMVQSNEVDRILVLGAGRMAKTAVALLGRSYMSHVTVASDNDKDGRDVASAAQRGKHVVVDITDDSYRLSELVEGSNVVLSLLPAQMHARIAHECILHRKDLVTVSYESDEIRALGDQAASVGISVLNEVGLDPGLDHMSAMRIIDKIVGRGAQVTHFSSVCGGLPAPEATDNPLKYKFSWSPMGVIRASQNAARYRWENTVHEVHGSDLLESAAPFVDAWSELDLECLPNRDSLQYQDIYGIRDARTVFRGTLRYRGFSSLMNVFKNMGLFSFDPWNTPPSSWNQVLEDLGRQRGGFASLDDFVLACSNEDAVTAKHALETLTWLTDNVSSSLSDSRRTVDAFCALLESKLALGPKERDMVVMHHKIRGKWEDGREEVHLSKLQVFGDCTASAMAKTVGVTAAVSVREMLQGTWKDQRGLLLPTTKDIYEPILRAVEDEGITFTETVHENDVDPSAFLRVEGQ